jgi:hypothetical protein
METSTIASESPTAMASMLVATASTTRLQPRVGSGYRAALSHYRLGSVEKEILRLK